MKIKIQGQNQINQNGFGSYYQNDFIIIEPRALELKLIIDKMNIIHEFT